MGETKRNSAQPQFCDACFSGDYLIRLTDLNSPEPQAGVSVLARGNR